MTEEQFWESNPRIWQVWGEAHKNKVNEQNMLNYYGGLYQLRALQVALEHAFAKNAKSEYYSEPIRIFELTEKEKQELAEAELQKFVNMANGMIAKSKGK